MIGRLPRREWAIIALLWAIVLVKGALWSLAFPLWQGPDEDDHYAVIQFIGEMGRLPDAGDDKLPDEVALSRIYADVGRLDYAPEQRQPFGDTAVGPGEEQFAAVDPALRRSFDLGVTGKLMTATPLYYVLATPVYRLTAEQTLLTRAHVQRLLAVLVSSPLVVIAWLTAAHLFPADRNLRLTIPFLVAFHPMVTEIAAVVSVDGLFFALYAAVTYLGLRVLQRGLTRGLAVAIGALFAAGMLIKPTMNAIAPPIALVVLIAWLQAPGRRRAVFWNAVLMNAVILPPVLWWMQRSLRLNNDLFYFNPVEKGHRVLQNPFYDYGFWQHLVDYYRSVWGGIFVTWWAHFGWLDTPLPPWVYDLLRGLTVLAIAGVVLLTAQRLRRRRAVGASPWRDDAWLRWGYLALCTLIPIVLMQLYDLAFWRQYGVGRGLQGRYWLTTVTPMLTFWTIGLLAWLPARAQPFAHWGLRLGMLTLNLVALLGYILPRYFL